MRYAQGPSLKLPSKLSAFLTTGRTIIIVVVPVIANTVQMRTISPYQARVPFGGISFGPRNFSRNVFPELVALFALSLEELVNGLICFRVGQELIRGDEKVGRI